MELREKIAEALSKLRDEGTLPPYPKLGENEHSVYKGMRNFWLAYADEILALIKQGGYVKLNSDQSLPKNPYDEGEVKCVGGTTSLSYDFISIGAYKQAQEDMLKRGFRRVEL